MAAPDLPSATASENPASAEEKPFALLDLPAELRNSIYRYALVHTSSIDVDATGLQEPALLSVSKQVRKETAPVFWAENSFRVITVDYNITTYMQWRTMAYHALHRGEISRVIDPIGTPLSCSPHWHNLLGWLRRYHDRSADWHIDLPSKMGNLRMEYVVLGGLFVIVAAIEKNSWAEVQKVLQEQRVILARIDSRWNDER